ncbi:MAG: pyrroline-5-carboxylate reductase [Myxococcales bacterium]|nr:pyrroline-5-carboxylate reductase [Myxococcales bacterium]
METQVGFLGCGQLGQALLAGWLAAGVVERAGVRVAARQSAATTAERFGVLAASPAEVVAASEVIVLAVKPGQITSVAAGLPFRAGQVVLSVAAGVPRAALLAACRPAEVVRIMPNVAARVGAGASLVLGGATDGAAVARAVRLFQAVGHVEVLDQEKLFHVGTALVGSGPAFLFVAMEALADGAVAAGLPRAQALRLAARVVAGSGTLAALEGIHPAILKDAVASPGGTTMQGLRALEKAGLRAALLEAVLAATARSQELEDA